jgi:inositol-phosphate phosphatase / L-galactose 1-phosphate phosphatase / histidinol-phosphatase
MDFQTLSHTVTPWLQEAGSLVRKMLQTGPAASELKPDHTPVTAIDRSVEMLLRERIAAAFPDHSIFGEEYGGEITQKDYLWLIDPIDGTRALMAGFPTFTTLLALTYRRQPLFGAVYQPLTSELWLGMIGERSLYHSAPIRTRPCTILAQAFFSTTSPLLFPLQHRERIESLIQSCKAYQCGGDAYAYAKLASGNIDVIVESGLKPHDFMPLTPLIEGAGGIITDWSGNPLTLDSSGDVCACGDRALHAQILPQLGS